MKTSHLGYVTAESVLATLKNIQEHFHIFGTVKTPVMEKELHALIAKAIKDLTPAEKPIQMAHLKQNALLWKPLDALVSAIEDIDKEVGYMKGEKLLIINLDDADGNYLVSFIQAGLRVSECLSLVESIKQVFLQHLGLATIE